jgi:RnfABCDGE-type electron transport complex C subunit
MEKNLVEVVQNAGIVGAGGAGFPTHVKVNCEVDVVVVNGAECEPLLRVDQQLMADESKKFLDALAEVVAHTNAKEGIVGLKKKYKTAIAAIEKELPNYKNIRIHAMENFYPAGDEQVLVYETTKRIVPEGGIPLNVGAMVINVETLLNIDNAIKSDAPLTEKYVTVTGAVAHPMTVKVPIGIKISELLEISGGVTVDDYAIINGGPMMGGILESIENPVTKTTKGLIVLPADHSLIQSKERSFEDMIRLSNIACMQCSLCSEVCPRSLLGHDLFPHKMMRMASYGKACDTTTQATNAFLCCECGLCQYACVMDLQPWKLHIMLKQELGSKGIRNPHHNAPDQVQPFRTERQFNVYRLVTRLGLTDYDRPAPMTAVDKTFKKVTLLTSQHIGAPAKPVVQVGDMVTKGQLVADIPEGKLSSKVFASIDGKVTAVDDKKIIVELI